MAQSFVQLATDGSGKKMDTAVTTIAAQHRQVMAVGDPATDANVAAVTAANALKVDGSAVTQPVSSASLPLPAGASTSAKQPALGTAGTASTDVLSVQGIASMTALKTDSSATTQPVSGTFWQATQPVSGTVTANIQANASTNVAQVNGVTPLMGNGVTGTGSLRVTLASDTSSNTNAFKVDGSAVTQPVSGTITANIGTTNGVALDASVTGLQVAQGSTSSGQKGGLAQGAVTTAAPTYTTAQTSPLSLTTAGALRVDNSAVTQPVSGTITANAGSGTFNIQTNAAVNTAQIAGTTTASGNGGTTTGTQRVTISNDSTGQVALAAGSATIGALTANQSVNTAQVAGATALTGNGVTGTGSQRVTIASDNTAFSVNAVESGTWTVQPGNTPNTTPWLVSAQSSTTGGWTPYTYVSAASTNATSIKGSAGTISSIQVFNNSGTIGYLKLFNKATAPTVGTDTPVKNILIPANTSGTGAVIPLGDAGVSFSAGIAFAVTGGIALLDTTATAANAFSINIDYK